MKLKGLFVDLRFGKLVGGPWRQRDLSDLKAAFTRSVLKDNRDLKGTQISMDSVHYTQLTGKFLEDGRFDFIVFGPQARPWAAYKGPVLEKLKATVRGAAEGGTPVMGICGGEQLLALAFGGKTDLIDRKYQGWAGSRYPGRTAREDGRTKITVLQPDPIFNGVTSKENTFYATEHHREEVKSLGGGMINLASSSASPIQVIRLSGRLVYGVQFHPERDWGKTAGKRIITNFLKMVIGDKK